MEVHLIVQKWMRVVLLKVSVHAVLLKLAVITGKKNWFKKIGAQDVEGGVKTTFS